MLDIALALLLWIPALLGLGVGLCQLLFPLARGESRDEIAFGEYGVLGIVALGFLAILLHFFVPLYARLSAASWGTGIFLLWRFRRKFPRLSRATGFAALVLFVVLCYIAQGSGSSFDNGSYYLPSLKMDRSYAASIGVANVYGPLGQSTIWFLVAALLWLPGFSLATSYALNSLLCFFSLLTFFEEVSGRYRQISLAMVFAAGALFFSRVFLAYCGAISPDLAVGLFVLLTLWSCLKLFEEKLCERLALTWIYAVAGLVSKPTAAFAIICAAVVSLVVIQSDSKRGWRETLRRVIPARTAIFLAAWLGIWCARNLFLSGCLLFPQKLSCIVTPWTVPASTLAYYGRDILFHAVPRIPAGGFLLNEGYWVEWAKWMYVNDPVLRLLFRMGGLCLVLIALGYGLRRGRRAERGGAVFLLVACSAASIFFLALAPVPRFAMPYLIGWGLALVLLTLRAWKWSRPLPAWTAWAVLFICLGFAVRSVHLTRVDPIAWRGWPQIPPIRATTLKNYGSVELIGPVGDIKCWDLQPPCTTAEIPAQMWKLPGPRLYALPGPEPKPRWPGEY